MNGVQQRRLRDIPHGRFFRFADNLKVKFHRIKGERERINSVMVYYTDHMGQVAKIDGATLVYMVQSKKF